MQVKKIAVGCDHSALDMKEAVKKYLEEKGIEVEDLGTYTAESCDYPDYAVPVCKKVTSGECEIGILICGTGIGMSIAANKVRGIRAAHCSDTYSAHFTRLHNDANVLCFGARVIGEGLALDIVEQFISTEYEGGRHSRRVAKITAIENGEY